MLDLLRVRPRTTGELADEVAELSRYAVMQHLDVLTAAGVVLVERRGRHRINHLNPVPLRIWYERWVQPVADADAADLLALRRYVEPAPPSTADHEAGNMTGTPEVVRALRIACELRFRTTPERLHDAMTRNTRAWNPYSYGGDRLRRIVFEPRVGGAHYEDWGDGRGHEYGRVTSYDPPLSWSTRGRIGPGTIMDAYYEITVDGDESVLRMTKTAIGPFTDEDAASFREHGDISLFEAEIRTVVEAD